jgi:hypothetical protein
MRRMLPAFASALVLATSLPQGVASQSVSDIVDQMYASYERQAANVDNYTVVQSVMGFETTSYFVKETVDGHPIFRMQGGSAGGDNFNFSLGGDDTGLGDVYAIGPELIQHARYGGREQVGDGTAHVLVIDDLSQVSLGQQATPDDMDFTAKTGRIYVDTEMLIPRRLEFTGDAQTPSGAHEVTVTIDMQDIRDVSGLLIPYRTAMQITGLSAKIDPETQAQLREMEEQLAALPPEQREMMERMLGQQLEQLRKMAAGGGDMMSIDVTVSDVRVNSGPPNE